MKIEEAVAEVVRKRLALEMPGGAMLDQMMVSVAAIRALADQFRLRPIEEWHEEIGEAVWWYIKSGVVQEAPHVGSPLDLGHTIEVEVRIGDYAAEVAVHRHMVGGWPGYHTHWTPLPPVPRLPAKP